MTPILILIAFLAVLVLTAWAIGRSSKDEAAEQGTSLDEEQLALLGDIFWTEGYKPSERRALRAQLTEIMALPEADVAAITEES